MPKQFQSVVDLLGIERECRGDAAGRLRCLGSDLWFVIKAMRRRNVMWAEVRGHLGREPTPDEVCEYFMNADT